MGVSGLDSGMPDVAEVVPDVLWEALAAAPRTVPTTAPAMAAL